MFMSKMAVLKTVMIGKNLGLVLPKTQADCLSWHLCFLNCTFWRQT